MSRKSVTHENTNNNLKTSLKGSNLNVNSNKDNRNKSNKSFSKDAKKANQSDIEREISIYKNVNNYRHIFTNGSGRDDNVKWLMTLRDVPPNIRARGKMDQDSFKDNRMKLQPADFLLNSKFREDKFKHKKNEYVDFAFNAALTETSNECKVYLGKPPSLSSLIFENCLRSDKFVNKALSINKRRRKSFDLTELSNLRAEENLKKTKSTRNKDFNSYVLAKNIGSINKLNVHDQNSFFNTNDQFSLDLYQTEITANKALNLNEMNGFNNAVKQNSLHYKNNKFKFSSINDHSSFLPPVKDFSKKILNSIEKNLTTVDKQYKKKLPEISLITRPVKYSLNKIILNNQKIVKKETLHNPETSNFVGKHNSEKKYDDQYVEKNINNIRHMLSGNEANLNLNKFKSSLRCNTEVRDNRTLLTKISNTFDSDHIKKFKDFSNLNLEDKKLYLNNLENNLRQKNRQKDPYSNLDFRNMTLDKK